MSRRPNRGGGEQARAAKAAAERARGGGRGGRRGGRGGAGGGSSEDREAPKWLATTSSSTGERYVPVSLSSASGVYVNGGPLMASSSASSRGPSAPLSDAALGLLAASSAPANVYRSSVHGVPRPVEVSEEQLVGLRHAITATRVHDLAVQSQLMAGEIGGATHAAPLFGDSTSAAASDSAADSTSDPGAAAAASPAPSPSPDGPGSSISLVASVAPAGSLAWLRLQVGQTLSHYQFRRRLVKSVQRHVLTASNLASSFATNREIMAQLQNFRLGPRPGEAGAAAASSSAGELSQQELVGLIQRATQACVDWLLVHAPESDLPPTFAPMAQSLQVVRLHDDAALALHSAAEEKILAIIELGLGFRRVDVVDAFRQVAGDLPELGAAPAAAAAAASSRPRVPLEALDENLVLWILFDWFDLRTGAPPSTALDAAGELDDSERQELRENECIVVESMFPESVTHGRTPGSLRLPITRSPLIPEGGVLELAIPRGNLYPSEPPLLIFTHPSLSHEAKRFVITQLYARAWQMQNEMMAYELHTWLTDSLHSLLTPHFPAEMHELGSSVAAAAAEAARREKEGTKEYQAKKARLAKKEAERLEAAERADRERAKVDREFAAKRAKEEAAAHAVVSKRIGGLVNVIGRLRAEEEEEEERRAVRIAQLKAIMEAEEAAASPSPPAPDANADTAALPASVPSSDPSDALDPSLVACFPPNGPLGPEEIGADDTLLGEKDALEAQDDGLQPPGELLFVAPGAGAGAPPAAAAVSAQKQRLNQSLLSEWRRTQQSAQFQSIMSKRRSLPAQQMKDELMRVILARQVIVVSGSTGCGKSTQVGQFILDHCIESGSGSECNIICTQPRRLAAIAVAERVAAERCERIGDTVGYSIRLESKRSARTRLLFCTTGILLRHLESSPTLAGISHIIVDEVHERAADCDFLLIILKGLLAQRPDLKLILMSATLNAEIFTKYFEGCDCIDIPGRAFPVQSLYLEDIVEATHYEIDARSEYARKEKKKGGGGGGGGGGSGSNSALAAVKELQGKGGKRDADDEVSFKLGQFAQSEKSAAELRSLTRVDPATGEEVSYSAATLSTLQRMDTSLLNYELVVLLVRHILASNVHAGGSILIFMSGLAEISTLVKEMKRDSLLCDERAFRIYPLHSLLSSAEQQRVFEIMPPGSGRTKIVIATNIAETSLTIEDVTVVIDSGKMKEMQYNSQNGMSQLVETNVSQANARQRAGRAGRVRAGTCYYLYTHQQSRLLPAQQLPEMLRVPLEQLCLRIKSLNLGSIASFLSRAIEPPSMAAIEHVVETLRGFNALERVEERLTPLGVHLAALPVDARIGKMMIFGCIFRCLDPILTIAAGVSVRSPFAVPFDKRDEADEIKRRFSPYQSDHLTLLAAYNGWRAAKARGKAEERNFCTRNFLSMQTLSMIYDMKKQLAVLLAEIGFLHRRHNADVMTATDPVNQHAANIRLVEAVIVAGLYPHVARLETPTSASTATGGGRGRGGAGGGGRDDRGIGRPRWVTREGDVSIHPSSVLFHESDGFDSPFLVFHEKVKTTKVYVRDATIVGAYSLLLFAVDMDCQHDKSLVLLDDWLSFQIKPRTAQLMSDLRLELRKILVEKIQCPSADMGFAPPQKPQQSEALLVDDEEGSEARSEFRRVLAPASMLLSGAQATSDPTSGLASSVAPGVAAIRAAPDLISVVALLLAEEDKNRRKAREAAAVKAAAAMPTHPAHAGVIATVKAAQQTHTPSPAAAPTPTGAPQAVEPAAAASHTEPISHSQPRPHKPRPQQSPKYQDQQTEPSNRDRPRSARPPKPNNDRAPRAPRAPAAAAAAPVQQWEESI